jgi:hypothetical protein
MDVSDGIIVEWAIQLYIARGGSEKGGVVMIVFFGVA